MSNNIFKLIFHHDQQLNRLGAKNERDNPKKSGYSLADFMTPDPIYSRFYFSGTDLTKGLFGLNNLDAYEQVINALEAAFEEHRILFSQTEFSSLYEAVNSIDIGETIVLTNKKNLDFELSKLHIDASEQGNYQNDFLKDAIEAGHIILYKVQAKDGFDIQMFSMKNVYRDMFFPLQKLVPEHFRFFSINGKKFNTERHFYFETWTLDRPPHGFEEVHPETVL